MRRWLGLLAIAAALWLPVAALAHKLPIITRDAEYNQRGDGLLTNPMATTWGGVVMQATVLFRDASGREIPAAALSLSVKSQRGKDGLCLNFRSSSYWFAVERGSMIALARWITSEGTGAFSAFDLSSEIMRKAGLTHADPGRIVPIEFRDTMLVNTLENIDFTDILNDLADTSNFLKTRQAASSDMTILSGGSYFNADLDSGFRATLSGGRLKWTGVPRRYHWVKTSGPYVKIIDITPFLGPTEVAPYASRVITEGIDELRTEISKSEEGPVRTARERELRDLQGSRESEEFRQALREATAAANANVSLYSVVATLRTIKLRNERAWNVFLDDLSSNFATAIQQRVDLEKGYTPE
jgi:hypothetical protein